MAYPSDEALGQMQAEIDDPTSDATLFSQYVQPNEFSPEHEPATQQDLVDLFASIGDSPTGFVGAPVAQEVTYDSTVGTRFQLAVQDAVALDNAQFVSQNHVMEPEMIPSFSTINMNNFNAINMDNFNANFTAQQKIYITSSMNSDTVQPNEIPNQSADVKPEPFQNTAQDNTDVQTSNAGPIRSRVGRNRHDEIPLYQQPEPENEQDKKKWRRAKTAYLHRQNKKDALQGNSKKIEELMEELNELKNQLKVVTAERDTYKDMCMTMCLNKNKGDSQIAFIQ